MMIDADVVAASPTTVYRVLKANGRLDKWAPRTSRKGTGFAQPSGPHRACSEPEAERAELG